LKLRNRNFSGPFSVALKLLLAISILNSCISCNSPIKEKTFGAFISTDTLAKIPEENKTYILGIPADSYKIFTGKIRTNRFLPDILSKFGISLGEIDEIVKKSSKVFDVREMRSGHNYTILYDKDSTAKARYFIYEHDQSVFYIFSFNDSINITPFRQKIVSEIKFSSATIVTSLWDAIVTDGLNPELAMSLSDIYAWTVDFFGLQKGDRFKVIYEERFIGANSFGIGEIYAAEFERAEKKIYAIPLIQDGKQSYYDSTGNSLRKAFLKAPLRFSRISSGFSSGRMHPILRIIRPHFGVDYAAPVGTPVHTIGDGRVISAGIEDESGRIVRVKHNSVYTTAYLHLSSFGPGIFAGAMIKQGDIVGYVGSSGLSTGPHLDFRFYKNGYAVDPLKVDAPAVEPVLPENTDKFEKIRTVLIELLGTFN
jgi:murein DD-endopeptidase MepM/ murein hydrolase activator NlpD